MGITSGWQEARDDSSAIPRRERFPDLPNAKIRSQAESLDS